MSLMRFPAAAESSVLLSVLEELPIGVWVVRAPDGATVYANRAFAALTGQGPRLGGETGVAKGAYALRDREGRPYPPERLPFCQALKRREPVVVDDLVIARADGASVNVRASGKPILDDAGAVTHVVVTFTDI